MMFMNCYIVVQERCLLYFSKGWVDEHDVGTVGAPTDAAHQGCKYFSNVRGAYDQNFLLFPAFLSLVTLMLMVRHVMALLSLTSMDDVCSAACVGAPRYLDPCLCQTTVWT